MNKNEIVMTGMLIIIGLMLSGVIRMGIAAQKLEKKNLQLSHANDSLTRELVECDDKFHNLNLRIKPDVTIDVISHDGMAQIVCGDSVYCKFKLPYSISTYIPKYMYSYKLIKVN